MSRSTLLLSLLVLVSACAPTSSSDHGHAHGAGGHDHGGGGGHADEEEGVSLAVTRWTATHELFVEFDAPIAGERFSYHAHVTRLADNHAADAGVLTLRFDRDGFPAESHTDEAVARAGIFASQAQAPAQPGDYDVVFTYADGAERAEWSAGRVTVGAAEPVEGVSQSEGEITFLKESQWQIPFHIGPAQQRAVAPVVAASGVVHPAPATSAVVAAPMDGLLVWSDVLPAVGRRVERGERLAVVLPVGAAEHWSALQAEISAARIERDLAGADLQRVEGLTGDELVSARRVDTARAALAQAEAQLVASQRRLSALSSGDGGAIAVRAPSSGTLVAVGAANGERVQAGSPLITVASDDAALIEARVFSRSVAAVQPLASLSLLRGSSPPVDLLALGAEVLTDRLIHDSESLSAPLLVSVPGGSGLLAGDLVELELGVGRPTPRVAVPRSAVVEINGQDVVFVQKTGESFTRRRVVLGDRDAAYVVVEEGIAEGDMVVIDGGFDVHVASLSGALESHKH